MPYHDLNDENTILACPDCGNINIASVEGYGRSNFSKDLENSLYGKEEDLEPWEANYKENYEYKYGYAPMRRQKHFICPSCEDRFAEYEFEDPDYTPIHPYNKLKKIKLSDAIELKKINPYNDWIENNE